MKGLTLPAEALDTKTDGHVHTRYCGHATGDMEDYVKAAISCGLDRIIFLEHLEVGINYFESTWLSPEVFERYWQEGLTLKERYKNDIDVGLGVEVGYNADHVSEIIRFLEKYEWDRIGLSSHFYNYEGRHVNLLSRKKVNMIEFSAIGVSKVLTVYLKGLLEAVKSIPVTVLCHLDAALRYHRHVEWQDSHMALVDSLLEEIAARGIALEINTSGFAVRGEPFPSVAIIEKAYKMGVKLLAGSDAHHPKEVGRYFDRLHASC